MAEKKPSGFRFRLPWLLYPSLPPARQPPTQPPRTTTQTSVASTPSQKPPFRPPGKAPAPPPATPPTAATPPPFSPKRSPQYVSTKSTVSKSPAAKTTEPVASQPGKETQATTETPSSPSSSSSSSSSPKSPTAKTTGSLAIQPTKETQTTIETIQTTITANPTTPPPSPPFSPPPTNKLSQIKMATDEDSNYNHKSTNPHATDSKSQNPKSTTAIKADSSNSIHKISTKESTDETPAYFITIAGNNTGALMQLGLDEIKRSYNLTTDENASASSQKDNEALPKAIVNSNIQGINNSMMVNSSVSEESPGVHLGFYGSVKNMEGGSIVKNTESIEMQRAEVNVTAPEKVVYDPAMDGVFTEPGECEFEEDDSERCETSYEIEVL